MNLNETDVRKLWLKAERISEANERNGFRKDKCGAWIKLSEYGNRDSEYGWEADHILPVARGGSDALSNLRPLHWRNNVAKSDGRLVCTIVSRGNTNIAA